MIQAEESAAVAGGHVAHVAPESAISRSRLEFFFDGIFAIAITILVLELHVPELTNAHSTAELAQGLRQNATTFGSYLLSFFVLGSFWYRHNVHYRYFRVITPGVFVLHFVQLAMAAFFPFCAALFGRYPFNPLAAAIYVGCVLVYLCAALANLVVGRRGGAMSADFTDDAYRRATRRMLRPMVLALVLFVFYLTRL